ncbi:MAG: leucine-rich repeat protein [Alphaproteobacteria bacterium]|nr:leucine-rich repeat protein [Alphaproteobacteria bacterium]
MSQIDTNKVFKNLKKHNGEAVAKLIRDNQLLDIPNIEHILEFAGNDPEDVKKLVPVLRSQYKIVSTSLYDSGLTPLELLKQAGYDAFVVTNLEQQNSIEKYFRPGEKLCTFNDKNRYINNYMIHAVKRGADKIKPADSPKRQDEYGTSVISIQIPKTGGAISIKNRYNHTVNNPDATFNNNPDNIIIGLTNSLQKFFDVQFNISTVELPDNYRLVEDQLVKHNNYEIDNFYFGPNYYFSGDIIIKINTGYQVMMDFMVLDEKEKKVIYPINDYIYGPMPNDTYEVFCEAFNGKTITRTTEKDKIIVTTNDGNRAVIKDGKIIELELPNVEKIDAYFLDKNQELKSLNLPKVKRIGSHFLESNLQLTSLNLPAVETIGGHFLRENTKLTSLNLPKVKKMADADAAYPDYSTLWEHNNSLTTVILPEKYEDLAKTLLTRNSKIKKIKNAIKQVIKRLQKLTNKQNTEIKER